MPKKVRASTKSGMRSAMPAVVVGAAVLAAVYFGNATQFPLGSNSVSTDGLTIGRCDALELKNWVVKNGGMVHDKLAFGTDDTVVDQRKLVSTAVIKKGEKLFAIPDALAMTPDESTPIQTERVSIFALDDPEITRHVYQLAVRLLTEMNNPRR